MHSFTFSDGTYVPAGNCICVPQQALMLDHANYSDPSEFQGFRYVNRKPSEDEAGGEEWQSTSRLTHPSAQFPFWGSVARAWYVYTLFKVWSYLLHFSNEVFCQHSSLSRHCHPSKGINLAPSSITSPSLEPVPDFSNYLLAPPASTSR